MDDCCRRCMSRRIYVPMGESAHGYMLTPLRGDVHWDRDFQRLEASIERSFAVVFCSAKVVFLRNFCGTKSDSYFPHDALAAHLKSAADREHFSDQF